MRFIRQICARMHRALFEAGQGHADWRLGNPWIYLDANSGKLIQARVPGEGSAGDLFLQAQFPLHSGRLFGVVGRVLISPCSASAWRC